MRILLSLALLVAVVAGILFWFVMNPRAAPQETASDFAQFENCVSSLLPKPPDLALISGASAACYQKLYAAYSLNEFNIRSKGFSEQYSAGRVVLWMVVIMTLSGVLLAGLQLLSAFVLANKGNTTTSDASELTVEQGKLVFKSSITGLMMLIVSFAFFFVFITHVYPVKDMKTHEEPPAEAVQIGFGELVSTPK